MLKFNSDHMSTEDLDGGALLPIERMECGDIIYIIIHEALDFKKAEGEADGWMQENNVSHVHIAEEGREPWMRDIFVDDAEVYLLASGQARLWGGRRWNEELDRMVRHTSFKIYPEK